MSKNRVPYGEQFMLLLELKDVECWNYGDCKATLPIGTVVKLDSVNDATHTTISLPQHKNGIPITFKDGRPYSGVSHKHPRDPGNYTGGNGYRFIVENKALGAAIGVLMPRTTPDIVGDIMAYESGQADEKQTKRLFKTLQRTGIGHKLQGHYSSRMKKPPSRKRKEAA